jgi:hypothetical protein
VKSFEYRLYQFQIVFELIPASCGGCFSIFNRFCGAAIDTRSALIAFIAPMWFSVSDAYRVCGTVFGALSTGNAFVCDIKRLCAAGKLVKAEVGKVGVYPW